MRVTFEYQPPDPKHCAALRLVDRRPGRGLVPPGLRATPRRQRRRRDGPRDGPVWRPGRRPPHPDARRVVLHRGGFRWGFEFSFDRFDCEAAPDRVFSLATYGLSPMDTSRGRAGGALPYQLSGLAACALLGSIGLGMLARRRSGARAAP